MRDLLADVELVHLLVFQIDAIGLSSGPEIRDLVHEIS